MKSSSMKYKHLFLIVAAVLVAVGITCFAVFPLEEESPDYSHLIGRWVRPDGGYVLHIQNVQPDGKLQAEYLNPRSINISKANANSNADKIEIFVQLRDRNYPGSYYKLTYDSAKDILIGVYHQLQTGQNYKVFFARKPISI